MRGRGRKTNQEKMTPEKFIEIQHEQMLEDFRKHQAELAEKQMQIDELNRRFFDAMKRNREELEAQELKFKKCDDKLTIYAGLFWLLFWLSVLVEAQRYFHIFRGDE